MKPVLYTIGAWFGLSPVVAILLSRAMRDRQPEAPRWSPPVPVPPAPEPVLTDEVVVVAAHGLASSCDVVIGAATTLRSDWELLSPSQRDDILATVLTQAGMVRQVLVDLTHGVADHVVAALDDLERPVEGLSVETESSPPA